MLFLLLAILSSSVLAIVLKYLSTDNTYGVYFVNYCTCALLAFLFLEPKSLWNGDFLPLGLGAVSGALYLAALIAYGYSIRKSGAVLSSVFSRLGVLVPILLSVCLFGEQPSLFQMGGLALALLGAEAGDCTLFEDSPGACRAAQAVGIRAVGVFDPFYASYEAEMRGFCDRYITSFTELL